MTSTRATIWTAAVALAAVVGSYGLACVLPFAALATLSALTLSPRRAFGLTLAVWAANQAVGYAFLRYPHTLDTALLGVAIGAGALAATWAARRIARGANLLSIRASAALLAAFAVYEGVNLSAAFAWGGLDTFAPRIVIGLLVSEFGWYLGLAAFRLLLGRREVPAAAPLPA